MFCRSFERAQWVWLALAGLAVPLAAAAAGLEAEASPFRISRWTTEDGLPQHYTSCVKQTHDGYLWLGTWFALVRFNGMTFTVFNRFNTPEMGNDAINALAEDAEQTLWVGTADGLVSYRDRRFHRWTTADGLPDSRIWRLASCRAGGIWLQAGGFVARLAGGKFSRAWAVETPDNHIRSLHEGADGSLNIVLEHAWLALSPKAQELRTNHAVPSSAPSWRAGLPATEPGTLWVGTWYGLHRLEQGVLQPIGASELGRREVDLIYQDQATNVWVNARPGGLYLWDHKSWRAIDLGEGLNSTPVFCLHEDREGNLWAGTDLGLLQIRRRLVRAYSIRDGLANDNVWSVCEGADGAIWAATDRGLNCIRDGQVVPLGAVEPQPTYRDRCLWPNRSGGVWIAKQDSGLWEFQDGAFRQRASEPALSALFGDRSGRLWVGTDRGVGALEGAAAAPYAGSADRDARAPSAAARPTSPTRPTGPSAGGDAGAPSGAARSGAGGDARAPSNSWQAVYTNGAGLEFRGPARLRNVRSIFEDRQGAFWFGAKDQGLVRWRQGTPSLFTHRDGLSNDRVWSIYEDARGALWLGTENGLTRYYQGTFFAFGRQQGLLENVVNCILEDDFGNLWLSGLRGIYRIKRAQLEAVADGRADQVECAVIDTAEGMDNSETNGERQPAGWKARDGVLWFPTIQGVVAIDPKRFRTAGDPSPVVLERVVADDRVIFGDPVGSDGTRLRADDNGAEDWRQETGDSPDASGFRKLKRQETGDGREGRASGAVTELGSTGIGQAVRLGPGRARVVEFHYTANTFVAPKRARFRYRLVGSDAGWRAESTERVARYTNLRPGGYRFEVVAANHYGVWSRVPAPFVFTVEPHFWQTWLFYLFCGVAGIGLAAGVQAYRLRWQHRLLKLEGQRALANERARIARDLHDDLGTALTGLALELDVAGTDARDGARASGRFGEMARRTRDLAERMREVVWTVNPQCDTVSSLASFLEQQVSQFLRVSGLQVRLDFPEDIPALPLGAEARHQLALSVREALANVVRHAKATEVVLSLALTERTLVVQIRDNGRGFQPGEPDGHGLVNMRARLEHVGGSFECESAPGAGTALTFRLPLTRDGAGEQREQEEVR